MPNSEERPTLRGSMKSCVVIAQIRASTGFFPEGLCRALQVRACFGSEPRYQPIGPRTAFWADSSLLGFAHRTLQLKFLITLGAAIFVGWHGCLLFKPHSSLSITRLSSTRRENLPAGFSSNEPGLAKSTKEENNNVRSRRSQVRIHPAPNISLCRGSAQETNSSCDMHGDD